MKSRIVANSAVDSMNDGAERQKCLPGCKFYRAVLVSPIVRALFPGSRLGMFATNTDSLETIKLLYIKLTVDHVVVLGLVGDVAAELPYQCVPELGFRFVVNVDEGQTKTTITGSLKILSDRDMLSARKRY